MGNRYLNSANAGSEVSPYDTVAGAASSFAQILALNGGADEVVPASEIIWVIDTHNETNVTGGVNTTWTAPTTATPETPLRVLCVTSLATPTTLSTGAIFNNSTAHNLSIYGDIAFFGITFQGSYIGAANIWNLNNGSDTSRQQYINCRLVPHNNASVTFKLLTTTSQYGTFDQSIMFQGTQLSTSNTYVPVYIQGNGIIEFDDCSLDPTSTATPLSLFSWGANSQAELRVTNSDLSGLAWTNFVDTTASTGQAGKLSVRNCKLPSGISWFKSGSSTLAHIMTLTAINCSAGDEWRNHEFVNERTGTWLTSTTIYTTTDPALFKAAEEYSIKMVSSAYTSRFLPLYSQWFCVWNDAAAKTPSVEVLVGADGASALNDDELWLEVDYNSGTDSPLGTRLTTCPGLLATPATCSAGTTAWTGDGYTTERTHKLSTAQITPDKSGFIWMRVALAKPSTTIYVNPPR